MKTFCVTFGQKSPLRDCWIEIEATDVGAATIEANFALGLEGWLMIYEKEKFSGSTFYPGGKIGHTIKA